MKKTITHIICLGALLVLNLLPKVNAQTGCHAKFGFHKTSDSLKISFSDSSSSQQTITSWLWDFGDGQTSTSQNPSHTYAHEGTYTVCLTIYDNHKCSNKSCHQITVKAVSKPGCHAAFGFHQTNDSLKINFSDSSSSQHKITSWLWDFGDGHTLTSQNPSHTYTHEGTYTVCLTIHDANKCSHKSCHQINVKAVTKPECHAAFGFHQTNDSLKINFSDSSSGQHKITSWLWDFGDGQTSTSQNPSHTYTHAGTYTVCLTIHDAYKCSHKSCHQITVKAVTKKGCHAAFTFHIDSTGKVIFTNTSTGTTKHTNYSWDFGDKNTSTDENPHHTYTHTGHFNVCLFIKDTTTGCLAHVCQTINNNHSGKHHNQHYALPNNRESLINYPNPFATYTTIQYELSKAGDIKIEVYDIRGNKINKIIKINESTGLHTQEISADNLNSGFYFIRVFAGEESFSGKISVIK